MARPLRKLAHLAVGATILFSVLPAMPATASGSIEAKLDDRLLAVEGPAGAIVHLSEDADLQPTAAAAGHLGLDVGSRWEAIGAFMAVGGATSLRSLAALPQVEYLEANVPIEWLTETSHEATRSKNLLDGEVTLPDGTVIDGSGIGVAVVDTGIAGLHPDLESRMGNNVKIVCPASTHGVAGPGFPYSTCRTPKAIVPLPDTDTPSGGGHGTHVAGIIAGTGASSGGRFHGAAPGATLYGVSIGYTATTGDIVDGLEWVLENRDQPGDLPDIRVVNNSWGGTPEEFSEEGGLHDAIWDMQEALVEGGVTVVMAAGNAGGGAGLGSTATGPCVHPEPGVICVANYDDHQTGTRDGSINGSSSRGQWDRPETWPDVSAPGTHITAACHLWLPVCTASNEGVLDAGFGVFGGRVDTSGIDPNYSILTGTSMAAPHVAGVVAQLLQANPSLAPADIEILLEDTAYKFESGSPYGLFPDPFNPTNSSSYEKGHGLVDALAAVRVALGLDPMPGPSTFPEGTPDRPEARSRGFVGGMGTSNIFGFFVPSITEQEFTSHCTFVGADTPFGHVDFVPIANSVDAYVMRIPEEAKEFPAEARYAGSNPILFNRVDVTYYDAECNSLGSPSSAGQRHQVPEAAEFVVIKPEFFAIATDVFAEFYDITPIEVEPEATSLSLSVSAQGVKTLTATLLDSSGTGIDGKTIEFYAGPEPIGTGVTTDGGRATLKVPAQYRASKTTYSATFAGDEDYQGSSNG